MTAPVGEFDPDTWPDGWDEEPASEAAPAVDQSADAEDFWQARRVLTHIRTFARARRVAPWAVLAGVLTRVVAATEPAAQLPPIVGSYASLNLFAGLVGISGAGKDAATKVAADALDLGRHEEFKTHPLGSGEALSHMFMREDKDGPVQHTTACLVTIAEIDNLTALVKRQASTVMGQLRQAAMGEQLGFFYVDTTKRMIVPAHRYRLCLIAGIQPKRSAVLLDDADGGTPQRFVWLPATDPEIPNARPDCPPPMVWQPPAWHETGRGRQIGGMYRNEIEVCRTAVDTIDSAHVERVRGNGDALDGHALLTRLKVAAALAILEGRPDVSEEDWELSGLVMQVSDATRGTCLQALTDAGREHNRRQAEAEASRTIVVQERVHDAAVQRVARNLRRFLARAEGWVAHGDLRKAVAGRDRGFFDAAVAALVLSGDVVEVKAEHHGQTGVKYRIAGDDR